MSPLPCDPGSRNRVRLVVVAVDIGEHTAPPNAYSATEWYSENEEYDSGREAGTAARMLERLNLYNIGPTETDAGLS